MHDEDEDFDPYAFQSHALNMSPGADTNKDLEDEPKEEKPDVSAKKSKTKTKKEKTKSEVKKEKTPDKVEFDGSISEKLEPPVSQSKKKSSAKQASEIQSGTRVMQNGITKPGSGKTLRIWEIADKISSHHRRPATINEVMIEGEKEGINPGTMRTQYANWCRFYGVSKRPVPDADS